MTIYTLSQLRSFVQGGVTDQQQTRVGRLVFGEAPWELDGVEQDVADDVFALTDEHLFKEIKASDWSEARAVWPAYEALPTYVENQPPVAPEFRSFAMMPSRMVANSGTTDYFKNLWKRGGEWAAVVYPEIAENLTGAAVTEIDVVSMPASLPKQFTFRIGGHWIYVLDWSGTTFEIFPHDFSSDNVAAGTTFQIILPNDNNCAPFELATTIPAGNFTEVVVTKTISGLPPAGRLHVTMDNGQPMWVAYTSYSGNTFTCAPNLLWEPATAGNLITAPGAGFVELFYMDDDANPKRIPENGGFLLSYFDFVAGNPLVGKAVTLEVTNSPTLDFFNVTPTNPSPGVYKFIMPNFWSVYLQAMDEENPPDFTLTVDEDGNDPVGWRPEALRPYQDAKYLRFLEANIDARVHASQRIPDTRKRVGYGEQTSAGFKIDLCNTLGIDAWITLPIFANEDFIRAEAAQFRDNLNPGLKVYVTNSNETFNYNFEQTRWLEQAAKNRWGEDFLAVSEHSKRLIEMLHIWNDEMGPENRHRWKGVAECQAANGNVGYAMLVAPAWRDYGDGTDPTPYHSEVLDMTFPAPWQTGYIDYLAPANYMMSSDLGLDEFRTAARVALAVSTQNYFDFLYAYFRAPSSEYNYSVHGVIELFKGHLGIIHALDPESTIGILPYEGGAAHLISGGSPPQGGDRTRASLSAENVFSGAIAIGSDWAGEDRNVGLSIEGTWTGTVTLQRSTASDTGPWTDVGSWTGNVYTRYDDESTGAAWYRIGIKTGEYGSGTANVALGEKNYDLSAATYAFHASPEFAQAWIALMKGFRTFNSVPMINLGVARSGIYGIWAASDFETESAYRAFFKALTAQVRAEEAAAA